MYLVPVIQLGIEIARTCCHQILRKQSYLPECRLSKTLSNYKVRHEVLEIANKRHEVLEIANKMCWQKCIWFQSSNLESKLLEHVATKF
jgi:hypothetical protein